MIVWESFKLAFSSLWNHKMRSLLTMLGIIIGVFAVIIIVAIGQGVKGQLTEDFFSTDENIIELFYEPLYFEDDAYDPFAEWEDPVLVSEDLVELRKVPGVKAVMGVNYGWGMMSNFENEVDIDITGVGGDYFIGRKIEMIEGRPINDRDVASLNRVVMIDTVTREQMFGENAEVIGEVVNVNDYPYKIVGVYKSIVPEEWRGDYGEALMPRSVISMMFGSKEIESIFILADHPDTLVETGILAGEKLTELKQLENGHYTTYDFSDWEEEYEQFLNTITLFIGSIAGISLLVGGIGVMNIMLVSVAERTREIGLRKAIGATRGKIMMQFLIESVTLTSIGGSIGIVFAILGSMVASQILEFDTLVSPVIVIIGVSFSAFIGIVFGILPAHKASKLSPINALRHE